VLDAAQGIAGPYAARLLGDLGAEVIKVEPPAGDFSRSLGPFWGGRPHLEHSGLFLYLNAGKRGVVLDLTLDADRRAWLDLAESADIVVESCLPGELDRLGLGAAELRARRPALVVVSATSFGQWGPRAGWRGNDAIAAHSSGFAYGFPSLQADSPEMPPLTTPTYAAEFLAGQTVAAAAVHGLLLAQRTGVGAHLDVSLQEAMAAANNAQFNTLQTTGSEDAGQPARSRRVFSDRPSNATVALLPCADGWIAISPREEHQWARWLEVMGSPAWGADPRFGDRVARERHWSELYPLLADWTRSRLKNDVFEAAQARRVACYPLAGATDLLASPQLEHRGFFVDHADAELPGVVLPGRPYHLDGAALPSPPRAPRLGEHTAQVLGALHHQPRPATTAALRSIRDSAETFTPRPSGMHPGPPSAVAASAVLPLEGARVVDFSWVLTGPICTRYLAALGAEVIKVESAARADLSQRSTAWEELNPSKRSVTLNLKHPRARELARDLIKISQVVVENFSSGVMERLQLDYQTLRTINPRLIMASSSALGRGGPERDRVAYGTLIQCFTGWAGLSAQPGAPPRSAGGVWTDPLTAALETVLILAAIYRQRTSGEGGFYDLSMAETTIAALPEPILAWRLNQEVLAPRGNRHPLFAPQGCYPAAGDDRWVALSVQSDAEWAALCRLMQRDDLLADRRLRGVDGRRTHHDTVDHAIGAWTATRPADETAAILQAHGIAATATREPAELLTDPHLAARAFVSPLERLDGTIRPILGVPWLADGQRPNAFRRAPRLGEDNRFVFCNLLGLDPAEYDRLVTEQVIY
jgi:crotonobetainyl-CoA:carnitine CoA-transferase CaiB-like acyl-CoA transferase